MRNRKKISFHKNKIKTYVLISLFAALIAVCSFITVPTVIPFTLQTLGIFTTLLMLKGKNGTIAVCLYILAGAIGIPVFSGFGSGIGHIMGATGGYITGFIFTGLAYWFITSVFGNRPFANAVGLTVGLFLCYAFGTLWYTVMFVGSLSIESFKNSFIICVAPFIIPDLIKLALALLIKKKTAKQFKRIY